jgi:hypothetical protein
MYGERKMKKAFLSMVLCAMSATALAEVTSSLLPNYQTDVGGFDVIVGLGRTDVGVDDPRIKIAGKYWNTMLRYGVTDQVVLGVGIGHSFDSKFKEHPEPVPELVSGTSNPSFNLVYKYDQTEKIPSRIYVSVTPKTSSNGARSSPTRINIGWSKGFVGSQEIYWTYGAGLGWVDKSYSINPSERSLDIQVGVGKNLTSRLTGSANLSVTQEESRSFTLSNAKETSSPSILFGFALGYKMGAKTEGVVSISEIKRKTAFSNESGTARSESQSTNLDVRMVRRF